jgi:unsaturated chondroitin disaccharide hydrolase
MAARFANARGTTVTSSSRPRLSPLFRPRPRGNVARCSGMKIDLRLTPQKLTPKLQRVFTLAGQKIRAIDATWDPAQGTPVFTVQGRYTSRGWTEWTQGFQFGMAFLQFDATGDAVMAQLGREKTKRFMASHVSHTGVHDHGFNNISTYGNLRRLIREGRLAEADGELDFAELALKISGAVQAARHVTTAYRNSWSPVPGAAGVAPSGYIYSFNGPQSLFADTIRSMRSLAVAHQLGHALMGEGDRRINLLHRAVEHAATTARFNVFFGQNRDAYDIRGRVAHESIFNRNDGQFRCPSSQQGYSPFTTWTRGAAWIICGYAEQLEFLDTVRGSDLDAVGGRRAVTDLFLATARAASDLYLEGYSARDGIPYWDSGAPRLHELGDFTARDADPFNAAEPVDSSAAAIAAQGFLRLGRYLSTHGQKAAGRNYFQAGLTIANTLFDEPYLSTSPRHQGLLLHSVYHRPNGWDYVPRGRKVPCGESSLWGDYHALELALLIQRLAADKYYTFF